MFLSRGAKYLAERGQILPLVLVLLAASVFIVVPGLFSAQIALGVNRAGEKDSRGYYAAEAGVADVIWRFKQGSTPSFPYTLSSINGMSVTLSQAASPVAGGSGTTYAIKSTAFMNNAPVSSVFFSVFVENTGIYPFRYAVISTSGSIALSGTVNSVPTNGEGNVFANGNLTVDGSVHGDGFATARAWAEF